MANGKRRSQKRRCETQTSASPKSAAIDSMQDVRPDAARVTASIKRNFKPATIEEQIIFRKWMHGVLIFYSAVALVLGIFAMINNHPNTALNASTPDTPFATVSSTNLRQHAP